MLTSISNWCAKRKVKNPGKKFKNCFITSTEASLSHSYLTYRYRYRYRYTASCVLIWIVERNKQAPSKRRLFWRDISGSTSSAGRLLHLQCQRLWSYWPNIDSAYTDLLNRKAQSTFSINPLYIHKHTKAYTCEGWFQVRDGRYNKVQDDESCLLLPSVFHLHLPLSLSLSASLLSIIWWCSYLPVVDQAQPALRSAAQDQN